MARSHTNTTCTSSSIQRDLAKYRNYTRVVAVLDVILSTLGFFFNPFNDEDADVSFLYWKITITCFIFEMWMIVSINLFVATQKVENPSKCVKLCNYWLVVSTLAFLIFQTIIVMVPPKLTAATIVTAAASPSSSSSSSIPEIFPSSPASPASSSSFSPNLNLLLSPLYIRALGILIYRIIATAVVLKLRYVLDLYAAELGPHGGLGAQESGLSASFPDLLNLNNNNGGGSSGCARKCQCGNSHDANSDGPTVTMSMSMSDSSNKNVNLYLNPISRQPLQDRDYAYALALAQIQTQTQIHVNIDNPNFNISSDGQVDSLILNPNSNHYNLGGSNNLHSSGHLYHQQSSSDNSDSTGQLSYDGARVVPV